MTTLSLQDNGLCDDTIMLYDANTGEPMLLASRATRKARRAARERVKQARIENRANRKIARQEAKTARQAARATKRMVRIHGKQAIIEARQKHQMNKYSDDDIQPSSLPDPSQDDSQNTVDGVEGQDYNQVSPDDSQYDSSGDDSQYDSSGDDSQDDGLSAGGIFGSLIKGAGAAIKNFIGSEVSNVKQGNLPVNLTSKQVIQLQQDKLLLQTKLQQQKTTTYIVGASGAVVGGVLGYLISKK